MDNILKQNSPFLTFNRCKWSKLRADEPMTLSEDEIETLRGINENFLIKEVKDVYLPLSRLIRYYIDAVHSRRSVLMKFLEEDAIHIPFVIGVAGSVSVGKSTTARVLQALLSKRLKDSKVALVTTDGFLYPNAILEQKKIMHRKGFPESYDAKKMIQFLMDIKSGKDIVTYPIYSHMIYDIVPNDEVVLEHPDILIFEGLNVLQSWQDYPMDKPQTYASDFLDFSIYVDADEDDLEQWYVSRFMKFRAGAFKDPNSYFNEYTRLSENMAIATAKNIWYTINRENLLKNILPTRERADLIIHKGKEHVVDYVYLRK